jgi:CheY-like chemotaxis protein
MKKSEAVTPAPVCQILLVDDNRNGLLARKSILEEHGFAVTSFSLPEEAIECFLGADFDLVITDYRMPNLNGVDVIRVIREAKPATPVILISGMVDALGLDESNTGADAVIPKSSTEISHLLRAVQRLLRAPKKPMSLHQGRRMSRARAAK